MAKNNTKHFSPDIELLTHKYADYYNDEKEDSMQSHLNDSYIWYDTRELYYPYYKSKIKYLVAKESPLHPIILSIFKILQSLEKIKNINILQSLRDITQLDGDILGSIISEYQILGYITQEYALSEKGKIALKEDKERIIKEEIAFVLSDGILGNVIESNKIGKDIKVEIKPDKDAIELKPESNMRLRNEELGENFGQDSNKTLRTKLIEGLNKLDFIESNATDSNAESKVEYLCEVLDITEVLECRKYFRKYICLFYKNIENREKILAIDENYEIDSIAKDFLSKLIDTNQFNANDNKAFKENKNKFLKLDSKSIESKLQINLNNGATIENNEHKKYFIYALQHAKNCVYIQSPWIRGKVLEVYEKYIESALKRNVKIYIKYGLDSKHRFESKPKLDKFGEVKLEKLCKKYPNLMLKEGNSHAKILICDESFMIIGSFNWLSFSSDINSKSDTHNDSREETSIINTNLSEIKKQIEKFKS